MVFKDPSYKSSVKNTFLEFSIPEDAQDTGDGGAGRSAAARTSPLVVAAKSPTLSPLLHPVDETLQAVPIDEVDFELMEDAALPPGVADPSMASRAMGADGQPQAVAHGTPGIGRDVPAYVVPTTPSPFMHSSFPPSAVPPFGAYGYGMPDMGLPPAYGEAGDGSHDGAGAAGYEGVDGQYLQGMQYMPEMYDPNYASYMSYWGQGMTVDGAYSVSPDDPAAMVPQTDLVAAAPEALPAEPEPAAGAAALEAEKPAKEGRRSKARKEGKEEKATEREPKPAKASESSRKEHPPATRERAEDSRESAKDSRGDKDTAAKGVDDFPPGSYTTVMLRNIPNKYTREMLIKQMNQDFAGLYDFMYLPIDFKNKCNVGYGFINFRTEEACADFVKLFHGIDVRKCLPGLNSKKIVEVTPARVQGLHENVRRLRNSPVMNQLQDHPEWMPLLFNADGEEEPFPMPEMPLPPVKPRGRNREVTE